jgi:hypothetical protein
MDRLSGIPTACWPRAASGVGLGWLASGRTNPGTSVMSVHGPSGELGGAASDQHSECPIKTDPHTTCQCILLWN